MTRRGVAVHRRRLGRAFTRLWLGFTLASSADGLMYGAVPLLAVVVNPHPFAVSAVVAADNLPWLLMALPAGHVADHFERGRVSALANLVRAAAMFAAVALIATDRITLALLLILVLVNAGCRAIYFSSSQAMVPGLVDTRDLEQANGVLTGTEAGAEALAGPIVGTTLFAVAKSLPFLADGFALLTSCIPFARFRSKATTEETAEETADTSNSMLEGLRLLLADRRLRVLLLMVMSLSGLQGMESGVLVLLATTEWGVRQGAYGFFLAAGAVGGLLGSFVADSIVRRVRGARTLIAAGVMSGVGYLIMAAARSWPLAAPAFALVCFAIGAGSVAAVSLRQRLTPDHLMGRVGSAWRGIIWGAVPVGALTAGALATIGGLSTPLFLAGILQCLVALALARPLMRHLGEAAVGKRTRSAVHVRSGDRPGTNGNGKSAGLPTSSLEPPVFPASIAHRGDPIGHRENTLPAFTQALVLGADWVELDLRRTKDDEIVVLHDQSLRRLWDLDASVGDLDLAAVTALGDGEMRIPTLRQVLAAVPGPLMVDFTRREVVAGGLEAVVEAGALDRSLFVTGNVDALRLLRGLSAEARIGLTWVEGPTPPLELLAELGAEYWNPWFGHVTTEGVAGAHDAGLRVSTWTVDSEDEMRHVVEAGVDAVVSNEVATLVQFLHTYSESARHGA
jgi:glycerophosphoryl diester phosphodiesterase/MFS family permease